MSEPAERRASYEDLLAVPEHLVAEIIHGKLVTSPRPAPAHALAASTLGMDIGPPFHRGRGGPGGWWILDEPELHLGPDTLVPDLAGWRRERMPTLPSTAYFELAPDWLCEVLSPSTETRDRTAKLDIYGNASVAWVWLLNPERRLLEIYERREQHWVLHATYHDEATVRAKPFDAIELTLADLWAPREP